MGHCPGPATAKNLIEKGMDTKKMKRTLALLLAMAMALSLAACGGKTEGDKAEGKTYKVGIVQFVDDASLNQIEAAIEAELDAKAKELGIHGKENTP